MWRPSTLCRRREGRFKRDVAKADEKDEKRATAKRSPCTGPTKHCSPCPNRA